MAPNIAQELWQIARPLERFAVRPIAKEDIQLTLVCDGAQEFCRVNKYFRIALPGKPLWALPEFRPSASTYID